MNYYKQKNMLATPNQIKAIKTISKMIFKTDADYREMLSGYGVQSCTKLDTNQATEVIKKLSSGLKQPKAKPGKPYGSGTARGEKRKGKSSIHLTGAQAERIGMLADALGWNNTSITQFIQRQTGALKAVQMLMKYEAMKVIVGMTRVLSANLKIDYENLNGASNNQLTEIFKLNTKGKNEPKNISG